MENIIRQTSLGQIRGNRTDYGQEYLGVRYATAQRFSYAKPIDSWDGIYDATSFGDACTQYRAYFPHLDVPERLFYFNEFRKGQEFVYSEDALNLNIFTPSEGENNKKYPVLVWIHGGGFNSGCNWESYLSGDEYVKRGVVLVVINYRVGVFGYMTHEELEKRNGRDGNFGLDDQIVALRWVKNHIGDFGGDAENITVMGQSAGAISIQYMSLSKHCEGLYKRAIMMSGAGAFPKPALPRRCEATRDYWLDVIGESGANNLEEFEKLSDEQVLAAVEKVKTKRKDNMFNTQPVVDGYLIADEVGRLIKNPLPIDYMAGYTNRDMYTIMLSHMAHKFCRNNRGYLYFFDVDAPGDDNGAFHSADLRYMFGTLKNSFRPYDDIDEKISQLMIDYVVSFMKTSDPNGGDRPQWKRGGRALCIRKSGVKMGTPNRFKLLLATFKGDPK